MAMTIHELLLELERAVRDAERGERILDVLSDVRLVVEAGRTIASGVAVARFGHDTYLPAAKRWQDYIRGHHHDPAWAKEMRSARASLAASHRWLYAHQKKSFENVLSLLLEHSLHHRIPPVLVDRAWTAVQAIESLLLTRSRAPR